jgi:gliding motility-associated protein GldM
MSIPKEPRQLMINLMYIVLTAILALNVSAEILNAFHTIDESMEDSSQVVNRSNQQIFQAIKTQAKAYSRFEPYREKATTVMSLSGAFYEYVENLKQTIVKEAGGLDEEGQAVRKTDKDIPTRILVNEGKGSELQQQVLEVRNELLSLLDAEERKVMEAAIPLHIREMPKKTDKKNWAQFTFQQMPVAAVLPILSKFQQDARISETVLLNYFLGRTGIEVNKPDAYIPIVSMEKSYLTSGETFRGEISLAAYSSTADNIAIWVDGEPLAVENGKAIFSRPAGRNGTRTHQMKIQLTNPVTGETETFERDFSYQVGSQSVTVAADKMNVLYVGVDNPISVSAAGVTSSSVRVNATGTNISKVSGNKYIAKPTRIGEAVITVTGEGLSPQAFEYRVKKIPDPVIKLGRSKGGTMSAAEMRVQEGLIPVLEGFDFDARCNITSFEVARVPKNDDARVADNQGGKFTGRALNIVQSAKRNDVFYFDEIRVKCPGDGNTRKMNGLIFKIK